MDRALGGGIAFDISKTNTGIAIFDKNGEPVLTTERSYLKYRYFGNVGRAFKRDVHKLIGSHEPTWVAYEEAVPINKIHMELHFGMVMVLAMMCSAINVPLFGVNTGSMKKFSLGNGRASKGESVEGMQARFPALDIPSHDVADALLVGLWIVGNSTQEDQ
jgi:Holliday junction resolvasome RuvABC endonuclease subunit